MSRPPWEWTEDDILALIDENQPEGLSLEYKRAAALDKNKNGGKKDEISKDVSAMANSAGGTIIYGIDENRHAGQLLPDYAGPGKALPEDGG